MSSEAPGAPAAGVIHDLGYRHYEGARQGTGPVSRALGLDALRGAYGLGRTTRSKVVPALLLGLACLPALVVAVVVNVLDRDELPVRYLDYPLLLTPVVALFVAGQAPASVSRDLRFRVVTLYFSRPLGRADYVRAKYAGLSAAVLVLLGVPLLLLYAGAVLARMPAWGQARGLLQGLLEAVLLAVLLAGIALVLAAITPRRGLGVAAVIVTLLMLTAVQGTLQGLGEQQDSPTLEQYSRLVSPVSAVDGLLSWWFGADPAAELARPSAVQGLACLAVVVVVPVACYLLLLLRYRRVSVS